MAPNHAGALQGRAGPSTAHASTPVRVKERGGTQLQILRRLRAIREDGNFRKTSGDRSLAPSSVQGRQPLAIKAHDHRRHVVAIVPRHGARDGQHDGHTAIIHTMHAAAQRRQDQLRRRIRLRVGVVEGRFDNLDRLSGAQHVPKAVGREDEEAIAASEAVLHEFWHRCEVGRRFVLPRMDRVARRNVQQLGSFPELSGRPLVANVAEGSQGHKLAEKTVPS